MLNRIRQVGVFIVGCLALGTVAHAADHDDTPAMKAAPRHDARVTDLHVFTGESPKPGKGAPKPGKAGKSRRLRPSLVIALSTNPTIPPTAQTYTFPADLTLQIFIDRHSAVDFDSDPGATATFGGTINDPAHIRADITFTITFDESGTPRLDTRGLHKDARIDMFAGLRDDPFIRGPRQDRNVASIVLEVPLQEVVHGRRHDTVLVWAMSSVPGPGGPMGDLGGRALRSQFAENMPLNDYAAPADHYTVLGLRPDVVIFDTTRPAAFPNGRSLTDDVVDLVGDPRILSTDCPVPGDPVLCNPAANDVAFLAAFPYLAPPHGVAAGNPGVTLQLGTDNDDDEP